MAYSTPPQWAHGDTVSHTDMQKYSDSLNAIYAILGDALTSFAIAHAVPAEDNDAQYHVHRNRWLWFLSDGELHDPDDPLNDVTLTEDTEPTVLDLRTIDWLYPGKLYQVTGCTWSMEDPSA